MVLSNAFISRYPAELLFYNALSIAFYALLWLILNMVFSCVRLRPAMKYLEGAFTHDPLPHWQRMIVFPKNMFWFTLAFGMIVSQIYQVSELTSGISRGSGVQNVWIQYVKSTLFNGTVFLMIAMVFYSLSKLILRPYVRTFSVFETDQIRFTTFFRPVVVTGACLYIIVIVRFIWYIVDSLMSGRPIQVAVMLVFSSIALIVGTALLYVLLLHFRSGMSLMTGRIGSLIDGRAKNLQDEMPLTSMDEVGELAAVYNRLRARMFREYTALQKEMEWTAELQQKLFPADEGRREGYRFRIESRMDGVGKEILYDWCEHEGNTAFLFGFVEGTGMPAALAMTSAMVLFRTEIQNGERAADALARLNESLSELLQSEVTVHMGIAVYRADLCAVEYAIADHICVRFQSAERETIRLRTSEHHADMIILQPEGWLELAPSEGEAAVGQSYVRIVRDQKEDAA